MDYIIFFGITIVLLVMAFFDSTAAKVVSGIGLIVIGMIALSGDVTATYYDNGTFNTYNLLGNEKFFIIPIAHVFGGIAILVAALRGNGGGDGGSGFTFAD